MLIKFDKDQFFVRSIVFLVNVDVRKLLILLDRHGMTGPEFFTDKFRPCDDVIDRRARI